VLASGGSGGGDVVTSLISMLLTGGSLSAGGLRQVNIQFKLSNQIEVFVRDVNGNYISHHLKLPDDPFYEYLKKTE
jgi:hypothetical protein